MVLCVNTNSHHHLSITIDAGVWSWPEIQWLHGIKQLYSPSTGIGQVRKTLLFHTFRDVVVKVSVKEFLLRNRETDKGFYPQNNSNDFIFGGRQQCGDRHGSDHYRDLPVRPRGTCQTKCMTPKNSSIHIYLYSARHNTQLYRKSIHITIF